RVPSPPERPEEEPRAQPAAGQVLREPGRGEQPRGHAQPPPAAPQADRHVPLPAGSRGRLAWHGLGRADRRRPGRRLDLLPPERPSGGGGMIGEYFKFAERGTNMLTEARGGLTTFMVMVYIVFLNASILGDGFKLAADDPGRIALSAGTALIAGIMTIAMGVY